MSLLACIATVAMLLFVIVQSYASRLAADSQDKILQASATSVLDAVSISNGDVLVDIPYSSLSMLGTLSDDRVYYHVTQDGQSVTGYDDLPSSSGNADSSDFHFETLQYRGNAIRSVSGRRDITIDSNRVNVGVTIAQTRDGQAVVLSEILRNTLLLCLGFFTIASIIGLLAVHVSLRPLRQFAEVISRRGPDDLRRVSAAAPKEMTPLVTSLNELIDRLRYSLSRTEDFLTEAAHRVRTPLATVRAEAEVVLHRVEKEQNRRSLRNMIRAIDQTSRAAGQLLDHAMVSYRSDSLAVSPVDMSDLCEEIVSRLAPVAQLRDIAIRLNESQNCVVEGDIILLQNAMQNVLDNAVKYAPRDSFVDVSVEKQHTTIIIRVQDEGAGFTSENAHVLVQRFARGDNTENIAGSGLGLTIVSEVVASHGGELTLGSRTDRKGAVVTIKIPSMEVNSL